MKKSSMLESDLNLIQTAFDINYVYNAKLYKWV